MNVAPGIITRKGVNEPPQTGIKAIIVYYQLDGVNVNQLLGIDKLEKLLFFLLLIQLLINVY